jgi:hydrogenase expression/formation protein HypC
MCLAIPGKIVELVPGQAHLGTVEVAGVRRKVDLGLLQDDMPVKGDWVLIHVGFAMTKISEQDAMEQMHLLQMLGEAEQAMQEVRGYGLSENSEHANGNPRAS